MAENTKQFSLTPEQEKAIKAFTTGYGVSPDTQVDAAALRREALSEQITYLTYQRQDLTLWKDLIQTAQPATSTVQKYIVYDSHGEVGHSRFTPEIGLAPENDPSLRQKTIEMKFMSDVRRMSFASQMVDNVADVERIETNAALTVVAKSIEWASFYGDSKLTGVNESGLEFDGLATLIPERNVIDLRGRELTEQDLNRAAVLIGTGYGQPTDAYMPIGVQMAFTNRLLDRQYQLMSQNGSNVSTGFAVTQFYSARGLINLHGSVVMDLDNILQPYIPNGQNPIQPATVTATKKAEQGGKFSTAELTAHSYKVVVHSVKSKSAPSTETNAVVTDATDGVELKINLNNLYGQQPEFVSVYRKAIGENDDQYYLLERVPASKAENGVITFVDINKVIPGTADVFVGEMNQDVISLYELLPMMRLDLAQVTSATNFAILWYGALALKAPKRWVRIRNVAGEPHYN